MCIKKTLVAAIVTVLVSFLTICFAGESTRSPIGYWKTMDEITGKPKSIVQVWESPDYILIAKVIKVFPLAKTEQNKICTACQGDNHNQPIIGMVIMSGLKSAKNQWANGRILDPENGKTYKCTARLTENGKKLNVRGYRGLPMFGRSQTWERVDLMSG